MSSVTSSSGALGIALASALAACGGNGATDLFAPSTGTGSCGAVDCGGPRDGGGATVSGAGGGSATTGQGAGGTSPGAAGGSTAAAGGGSATGGGPGTGGLGGSGAPMDSGRGPPDATVVDATATDGRVLDALRERDVCVPTGVDVCDGLDNNCNGVIDESACPDGCVGISRNGVGYMLCYAQNQHRAWRAAETQCTNRSMHLVRIDDAEQNAWIRAQALAVNFTGIIWIGGSDLAQEGNWIWIDGAQFWMGLVNGRAVNGLFSNWDIGQPNSAGVEDCAAMWMNTDAWHDVACANINAFLCQGP